MVVGKVASLSHGLNNIGYGRSCHIIPNRRAAVAISDDPCTCRWGSAIVSILF